jgi:hypothetical protein
LLQLPDRGRNGNGTGVVDILQADKSRIGQGRLRPSDAAEQYHAFLIGNRRHSVNYILRWVIVQQPFEERASLDPPHSSKGGCCRCSHSPVKVVEEVYQNQDQARQRTGAATGIGSNTGLGMSQ